ncbi:hypothetical protein H4Q26_018280, partial [Puccinia striiformis f. sp. tritici PST-130]
NIRVASHKKNRQNQASQKIKTQERCQQLPHPHSHPVCLITTSDLNWNISSQHQTTQPSGSQEADEPPPAYTPSPADPTTLLEVGPQYPFQNTEPQHQQLHQTQHPSYYPQAQLNHHQPPPPHHHYHHQPHQSHGLQAPPVSSSSHAAPLPAPNEPTTVPTAGRPLLYENRILVYPYVNGTAYFCPKCCNTGFKGFDPNRPCRKCWTKYGKSWSVSLHPTSSPSRRPKNRGRLCLNCNGSGQKIEELTLFNVFTGGPNQESRCISRDP